MKITRYEYCGSNYDRDIAECDSGEFVEYVEHRKIANDLRDQVSDLIGTGVRQSDEIKRLKDERRDIIIILKTLINNIDIQGSNKVILDSLVQTTEIKKLDTDTVKLKDKLKEACWIIDKMWNGTGLKIDNGKMVEFNEFIKQTNDLDSRALKFLEENE